MLCADPCPALIVHAWVFALQERQLHTQMRPSLSARTASRTKIELPWIACLIDSSTRRPSSTQR